MPLQVAQKRKMEDRIFSDPLGDDAAKHRKVTLFLSLLAILVESYDVKIKEVPYFSIETSDLGGDFVKGLIALILAYQLLVFLAYSWVDLKRWFHAKNVLLSGDYFGKIQEINSFLDTLSRNLDKIKNHDIRSDLSFTFDNSMELIGKMEGDLEKVHRQYFTLELGQGIRIFIFDLGVPIALGLIAMTKVGAYIPSLVVNAI